MDPSIYTRPNKPKTIPVKKRARDFSLDAIDTPMPISVDRVTECHVTPDSVAARMADYLNLNGGMTVLEPQCGTGNLIAAVLAQAPAPVFITGVERHVSLYQGTVQRFPQGVNVINACFLEYAATIEARFDRAILNPPFRNTQKHVLAAHRLLAPGGYMIALVPITYQHPEATEIEVLERGIFPTTNVATKIIELYA